MRIHTFTYLYIDLSSFEETNKTKQKIGANCDDMPIIEPLINLNFDESCSMFIYVLPQSSTINHTNRMDPDSRLTVESER